MAELLVRNLSDDVEDEIHRRALARGVSPEEEAGAVLSEAIVTKVTAERGPGEEGYTLLHHLWKLGEIAPDFEFVYERTHEAPRPLDLE